MSWKAIHRWLGLTVGTLAVVLGVTGAMLAIDPVQQAWQAPAAPGDLPVAMLVERVTRSVPGVEEIRRLPSGAIAVFSFAGDQPQASFVDPADGQVLLQAADTALPLATGDSVVVHSQRALAPGHGARALAGAGLDVAHHGG